MISMRQPHLQFSLSGLDGTIRLSGLGATPVWNTQRILQITGWIWWTISVLKGNEFSLEKKERSSRSYFPYAKGAICSFSLEFNMGFGMTQWSTGAINMFYCTKALLTILPNLVLIRNVPIIRSSRWGSERKGFGGIFLSEKFILLKFSKFP